jgi:hypothetical protein
MGGLHVWEEKEEEEKKFLSGIYQAQSPGHVSY